MSQIKVYANKATISSFRNDISDAIHNALVDVIQLPKEKRFQRFITLDADDFIYPSDRSDNYLIIEISMFAGRNVETKKQLIKTIFANINKHCGIDPQDVEMTIFETPKENWGIRGMNADELSLNYKVNV